MRRRSVHLLALGAVLVTLLASCGGGDEVSSGTPGYEDPEAEVDTSSPFTIARPTTTEGATTLPGPAPTLPMPDVFKRQTTTLPSQPSATAAPPTTLVPVAVPAASTPTCDAFYHVASAGRDVQLRFVTDPNTDFEGARRHLLQGLNTALNTITPRLAEGPDPETAVALRNRIMRMKNLAETAMTLEQAGAIFYPLQTEKEVGEEAGWPEILSHLTRYCVNVPRTFGIVA